MERRLSYSEWCGWYCDLELTESEYCSSFKSLRPMEMIDAVIVERLRLNGYVRQVHSV